MWPNDYLNMCHIFYYNFSANFLQSTWIRPQKNLLNQDPWGDITYPSPSSKHYHFKRQGNVGQSVLSAHNGMIQYTCKRKVVKVYLWNAIVTEHLVLTTWHSNIYWNDNVYCMDGDWQVMSPQESWFGRFFCGRIQVLWRKLTEKL